MARRQRGRGGRPSKGERDLLVSRVPRQIAEEIRKQADDLDITLSEYIAGVLAEAHGFERPLYERERIAQRDQEELPISA